MIIGFIGPKGSGKTLGMTERLSKYSRKGHTILTNYSPVFSDGEIEPEDIMGMSDGLQDCAMGIDEMHVWLDSRLSGTKRNVICSYFITQTRKRGIHLFYTSQVVHQVEKRVRDNTDTMVFAKQLAPHVFYYQVYDWLTGRRVARYILNGKRYYGLYDTRQAITQFQLPTQN